MNLTDATVFNSPADIASWPATGTITKLTMSPEHGISVEFTTKASWPDYLPPGWKGPIEYTLWVVAKTPAGLATSGFIQIWRDRDGSGGYESGSFLVDFHNNWAYDQNRWGSLFDYHPQAGDTVGFFVSAGNARGEGGVTSVRERSNVVEVQLQANDRVVMEWGLPTPVPPPVTSAPPPAPEPDLVAFAADVLKALAELQASVKALSEKPAPSYTGSLFGAKFVLTPK